MNKKQTQELIKRAGGAYFLAEEISKCFPSEKLTHQAIYNWSKVPLNRCRHVEYSSNPKVTVEQLRPDVFRKVLIDAA